MFPDNVNSESPKMPGQQIRQNQLHFAWFANKIPNNTMSQFNKAHLGHTDSCQRFVIGMPSWHGAAGFKAESSNLSSFFATAFVESLDPNGSSHLSGAPGGAVN